MDILQQSYNYGKSPLISSSLRQPYNTYLFGGSISHSLSPLLHGVLFGSHGTSWKFHLAQTTNKLKFKDKLAASDTIGISITMPNKVTFGPLLDDLAEPARVIGAVNTTFVRLSPEGKRRHIGTNTDCVGIREAIFSNEPDVVTVAKGNPAMVIGGGGAARSAIYTLWKWFSPSEIYIANRFRSEVDDIMAHFEKEMPGIRLRYIADVATAEALPIPSIIVSTIPDYPPSQPEEILCAQVCERIIQKAGTGLFVDMCYMPSPKTRLLNTASGRGWKTIMGTDILVRVCIAQQILWLERLPNDEGITSALKSIVYPREIVNPPKL
ncbi:hypothetical protein N7462_001105 [Penicillium macrosclerotiorum]|uniref:uncharacterized protein n=1 Tax=Penicillium macrosclerotiorum TaxID=303699 RepID=UPI002549A9D9|nr:uncharacterized protein N7462_001105 [Penicillium macrosclerotiorum]KAJ5699100.1 hypothetical protein N7462_001105 [Penicillium macrosclerotiorum]